MQPEQVWNRGTVMVSNLVPVQQLVSSRYSIVCHINALSGVYLETGCHTAHVLKASR